MYGDPIKIQIGTIYMNRTRAYLLPVIKAYGEEFTKMVSSLNKLAVGIGDIITNESNIHHEKHLFILVDILPNKLNFSKSLTYFRNHSSYEDDYVFDSAHDGRLHMLVIQIPNEFVRSLDFFKKSKFSEMYTPEEIEKFFSYTGNNPTLKKMYEETKKVLIKDNNYRFTFAKKIEEEFYTKFPASLLKPDQELDFPILVQEEFFNSQKDELQTE